MEVDDRPNRPKKPMLTYWVIAIIVFLILNTFVFPNLFRRQVEAQTILLSLVWTSWEKNKLCIREKMAKSGFLKGVGR